jgi:hypothetical protein
MLCGLAVAEALLLAEPAFVIPLDFPSAQDLGDPSLAQHLGWPILASQTDPKIWAQLPGVGPVLAGRLAALAERGDLRSREDLLQVRGIGIKMADRLEPWIQWPQSGDGGGNEELPRRPLPQGTK